MKRVEGGRESGDGLRLGGNGLFQALQCCDREFTLLERHSARIFEAIQTLDGVAGGPKLGLKVGEVDPGLHPFELPAGGLERDAAEVKRDIGIRVEGVEFSPENGEFSGGDGSRDGLDPTDNIPGGDSRQGGEGGGGLKLTGDGGPHRGGALCNFREEGRDGDARAPELSANSGDDGKHEHR